MRRSKQVDQNYPWARKDRNLVNFTFRISSQPGVEPRYHAGTAHQIIGGYMKKIFLLVALIIAGAALFFLLNNHLEGWLNWLSKNSAQK